MPIFAHNMFLSEIRPNYNLSAVKYFLYEAFENGDIFYGSW